MDKVRLDKYLWAIRVFKTRSEAAEACNGNKVRLNGVPAKASKEVKIGDLIEARKGPMVLTYSVLQLSEHRMGARRLSLSTQRTGPPTRRKRRPMRPTKPLSFKGIAVQEGQPRKNDAR